LEELEKAENYKLSNCSNIQFSNAPLRLFVNSPRGAINEIYDETM
jgi:hypothetical protein